MVRSRLVTWQPESQCGGHIVHQFFTPKRIKPAASKAFSLYEPSKKLFRDLTTKKCIYLLCYFIELVA